MKTSKSNLISILATVAGLMTSSVALAGHGHNGGNGGGGNSGKQMSSFRLNSSQFTGSSQLKSQKFNTPKIVSNSQFNSTKLKTSQFFGNNSSSSPFKKDLKIAVNSNNKLHLDNHNLNIKFKDSYCKKDFNCHDGFCWWKYNCYSSCYPWYYGCYYPTYSCYYPLYNCYSYCGIAYEPLHCSYVVLPGDSFYTISLKEYGTSVNGVYIARFNNLSMSTALAPGQMLMLPSISSNKTLSVSGAPAAIDPNAVAPATTTSSPISPVGPISPFISPINPSAGSVAVNGG